MDMVRRLPDGGEIVTCRACGRQEEVAASGYAIPRAAATRAAPAINLMAEIATGLPAELQGLFK